MLYSKDLATVLEVMLDSIHLTNGCFSTLSHFSFNYLQRNNLSLRSVLYYRIIVKFSVMANMIICFKSYDFTIIKGIYNWSSKPEHFWERKRAWMVTLTICMWDEVLTVQFRIVWVWKIEMKLTFNYMCIIFLEYKYNIK